MRLRFSKEQRLVTNRQFKAVLDHNRRAGNKLLTLFAAPNHCTGARLGVSVGRACGNAVTRNRLKRLMREAFRQSQHRVPQGCDYVLMASPSLSRNLGKPDRSQAILAALTHSRMQKSFLSLVATIFGKPGHDADQTYRPRERKTK